MSCTSSCCAKRRGSDIKRLEHLCPVKNLKSSLSNDHKDTMISNVKMSALNDNAAVSMFDQDERVRLYSLNDYITNNDTMYSDCRGLVYRNDNDELVFKGFPFCRELAIEELPAMGDTAASWRYFYSVEGTIIRVFNVDGHWYTSTNRKLDAFKSRWVPKRETIVKRIQKLFSAKSARRRLVDAAAEEEDEEHGGDENVGDNVGDNAPENMSFGERFALGIKYLAEMDECDVSGEDVLDGGGECDSEETRLKETLRRFYDAYLDPTKGYVFIVRSSKEDRIVCDAADVDRSIVHVGTFHSSDSAPDFDARIFSKKYPSVPLIPSHNECKFKNSREAAQFLVEGGVDFHDYQGLFAYDANKRKAYKIVTSMYYVFNKIRGNVPSLKFRYLQLRKEPVGARETFFYLYPEMREDAALIELGIWEMAKRLHKSYLDVYVNKSCPTSESCATDMERKFLEEIHRSYLHSRVTTTASRIVDILTMQPPVRLNKLLKRFVKRVELERNNNNDEAAE